MFIVQMKIVDKSKAPAAMEGHNAWIKKGFDDGFFHATGNLIPGPGGAVIASGLSRSDLEERLKLDPFVSEGVVSVAITEIEPKRTDAHFSFLIAS